MSSRLFAVALVTCVAAVAPRADAQQRYPLAGNVRFQVGSGLQLPIGFTPPPDGKVLAIEGAWVAQTSGSDPKQITFPGRLLTHPGGALTLAVGILGPNVAQVQTNVTVGFPGTGASGGTFKAGGRTGAATVTFCPGQSVTAIGNPGCSVSSPSGGPGTPQHILPGFLRYTATGAQFGGAMQGRSGGTISTAFLAAVPSPPLPCDHAQPTGPAGAPCWIAFVLNAPLPPRVLGGPFGFVATSPGAPPPAPGGLRNARLGAAGTILSLTSPGLGAGLANPVTSFGGPWTTGMVTISQSGVAGPPSVFVLTGSDNRVNGFGTISLVAGGLSQRRLHGRAANRGWLNLTIGSTTPGLAGWAVGFLAVLLAGAAVWTARRSAPV